MIVHSLNWLLLGTCLNSRSEKIRLYYDITTLLTHELLIGSKYLSKMFKSKCIQWRKQKRVCLSALPNQAFSWSFYEHFGAFAKAMPFFVLFTYSTFKSWNPSTFVPYYYVIVSSRAEESSLI